MKSSGGCARSSSRPPPTVASWGLLAPVVAIVSTSLLEPAPVRTEEVTPTARRGEPYVGA